MTTPVFLLSLPRAGSTLVQRVLAAHPDVATASEPWLLLPAFYARRRLGIRGEYGHNPLHQGIADFVAGLPEGEAGYRAAVARFADDLYGQSARGARWFLDKTPRYYLIADELFAAFPQARFIFLWRQPLAVAASIVESFCGGRMRFGDYALDLQRGPVALARAAAAHGGRAISVQYERLIRPDLDEWRRIFSHLDLAFDPGLLDRFAAVRLQGQLGDQIGVNRYGGLSAEPIDKWRRTFAGWPRRGWCLRYLRSIDAEVRAMGYDPEALADEVRALSGIPVRPLDQVDLWRGALRQRTKRAVLGG